MIAQHSCFKNSLLQEVVDLAEGLLADDNAVESCNSLSLFYLLEYSKLKMDMTSISSYYDKEVDGITTQYFDLRS